MLDQMIGTREDWQAARDELAKLEAEHAELTQKVTEQRRQLPWVPVEQEYEFDTQDGKKTLAELFDGRSQLLAYNVMFGPDYEVGACPGCSNLGDELDATRIHLNHRDVTLICFSRAPIDRLTAYKERMGWQFPYVSTYGTEFPFAFARENGTVYHTYTVSAPDPFVAPYNTFLLERTPKPGPETPRAWRKDEYPD
jgi:predicted dithiol-disulfide oxidoreductase (DUF899 family)